MAQPREIRDAFTTLINDNQSVIADLEKTLSQTTANRLEVERALGLALNDVAQRLLTPVDHSALDKLASVSGAVNVAEAYDKAVAASKTARTAYEDHIQTYGDSAALQMQVTGKEQEVFDTSLALSETKETCARINGAFEAVTRLAKKHPGKPTLDTVEGVAYFSSKHGIYHYVALVFSGHYRSGRALLQDYAGRGQSIPALIASKQQYQQQQKNLSDSVARLTRERDHLQSRIEEAQRLLSLVVDENTISEAMQKEIVAQLHDKTTLNRATVLLPEYVGDEIVEMWAKADAYARIESSLTAQKQRIQGANSELNEPMAVLNKAVNDNVKKPIDKFDLQKTVAKMQSEQAASRTLAAEMAKANSRIKDFSVKNPRTQWRAANAGLTSGQTTTATAFDIIDTLIIYDMIGDIAGAFVNPSVVQMTLGIPESVANASGLDIAIPDITVTDVSMPDVDTSIFDGLGDALSSIGETLGEIGSAIGDAIGSIDF